MPGRWWTQSPAFTSVSLSSYMKRAQPLSMMTMWNSASCRCQPVPLRAPAWRARAARSPCRRSRRRCRDRDTGRNRAGRRSRHGRIALLDVGKVAVVDSCDHQAVSHVVVSFVRADRWTQLAPSPHAQSRARTAPDCRSPKVSSKTCAAMRRRRQAAGLAPQSRRTAASACRDFRRPGGGEARRCPGALDVQHMACAIICYASIRTPPRAPRCPRARACRLDPFHHLGQRHECARNSRADRSSLTS